MPPVHPANLVANSGNALFGVVLLMHALDTCFWHQSPHTSISTHDVLNFVGELLTHWGRVTHICVSKLTIIGSDNGLSPGRRQAIIWTNTGILLIEPSGTNFNEILIEIHTFSFKKMHLKLSFGKCQPSCLGLNVLRYIGLFYQFWMLRWHRYLKCSLWRQEQVYPT